MKPEYLVRVRFYADMGEHTTPYRLGEHIGKLDESVQTPDIPRSAKEQKVDKVDFITVEVFRKIESAGA